MSRRIRVRDLKSGQAYGQLYCRKCDQSYSADRGDYFLLDPDAVMCCGVCNKSLALVKPQTKMVEVAK